MYTTCLNTAEFRVWEEYYRYEWQAQAGRAPGLFITTQKVTHLPLNYSSHVHHSEVYYAEMNPVE